MTARTQPRSFKGGGGGGVGGWVGGWMCNPRVGSPEKLSYDKAQKKNLNMISIFFTLEIYLGKMFSV